MNVIPQIVRARDFYLYTKDCKRLVDMWQFGGRAILGHKSSSIVKEIKNTIDRGLFSPLPSVYEYRFLKALNLLFGNNKFFYVDCMSKCSINEIRAELPIWRPYIEFDLNIDTFRAILPCPICPDIIVARGNLNDMLNIENSPLAPFVLSAAARSIYDLIANKQRDNVSYPKIISAISNRKKYGGEHNSIENFERNGIYITHNIEDELKYKAVFFNFLEQGFLLPPNIADPIILPPKLSDGEESKIAKLFLEVHFRET